MNAFTVDVEEHFQVAAMKEAVTQASWAGQESRVDRNTRRLLELLESYDVKGTFFVLGWVAERQPALVREIVAAGHELGCHGQSHQLIYDQDPVEFRAETLRARQSLEDIAGVAVEGYRAASYSITRRSLWALEIIADAGFTYDSSIVPARHDLYGIPGAPDSPYNILLKDGRLLREFPPSTIRVLGQRIPIGGGGYFRIFPYWFTRWGLNSINNGSGQPFSFYTHPWEIDVDQPRIETNWKSRFRHYTNLDKCESRLHRLLSDFDFSNMRAVLDTLELRSVDLGGAPGDAASR